MGVLPPESAALRFCQRVTELAFSHESGRRFQRLERETGERRSLFHRMPGLPVPGALSLPCV